MTYAIAKKLRVCFLKIQYCSFVTRRNMKKCLSWISAHHDIVETHIFELTIQVDRMNEWSHLWVVRGIRILQKMDFHFSHQFYEKWAKNIFLHSLPGLGVRESHSSHGKCRDLEEHLRIANDISTAEIFLMLTMKRNKLRSTFWSWQETHETYPKANYGRVWLPRVQCIKCFYVYGIIWVLANTH